MLFLYCTEKIRYDLNKENIVTEPFLDLSNTFDSISHPILLHKTKFSGLSEQANTILKPYLENCVQKAKFSKYESKWIALNRGVPQDNVLGPLFFTIYVYDMKDDADVNSKIIQYADDTLIFRSGKIISESKLHLEKSIAKHFLFIKKNDKNVNETKIALIIFGTPKRNKIEEIVVNRCTVHEKKVAKYLGVNFDCNLSFDEEIKNVLIKLTVGIKVTYSIKNKLPE